MATISWASDVTRILLSALNAASARKPLAGGTGDCGRECPRSDYGEYTIEQTKANRGKEKGRRAEDGG
ncbi:MAG: hypothetical protein IPO41_11820 [Acidobacteria bacterium]|nr:hypothetical protein [Acidobacteriota bacterium]